MGFGPMCDQDGDIGQVDKQWCCTKIWGRRLFASTQPLSELRCIKNINWNDIGEIVDMAEA